VWERTTAEQLAQRHGKSLAWVRRQLDKVTITATPVFVEKTVIVADATFWGRGYGVLVLRCPHSKKNLHWQEICTETVEVYHQARMALEQQGCLIQAVVLDGKPGIRQVFADVPIQQCHFHQMALVTRYLTRQPKLLAGQELRRITLSLPHTTQELFAQQLQHWQQTWAAFLKERTLNLETHRWYYTHRRLRSAYRSLTANLPYLFSYQAHPQLQIPNTTNGLDGTFSHLKRLLSAHHGLKRERRLKLIHEILNH